MPEKRENFLKRYPIIPSIFFILFAWSLLHLITAWKKPTPKTHSTPTHLTDSIQTFACHGTEPFWSVQITPKNILFETMENEKWTFRTHPPKNIQGRLSEMGQVFESKDSKGNLIKVMVLFAENKCNDGMSDQNYRYRVLVELNGIYWEGCCE